MSDRKCGEGVIYSFEVENADQEYRKLKDSQVEILYEIRTEEWGQRHFMIRDPGGMVIDLVQTVEPTGEYTHLETRNSS
jgi:uncharacterized glyoxalase superfamily protein PhnB